MIFLSLLNKAISPMSCIIQTNKVFGKASNLGLFDGDPEFHLSLVNLKSKLDIVATNRF